MSCIRICILAKELLAISYCPLVIPMTLAILSVFSEEETFYVPNTLLLLFFRLYIHFYAIQSIRNILL